MSERPRTGILDTGLLLLFLVGRLDLSLLDTFKRVKDFYPKDLALLDIALRPFQTIRTTPHILAEVSNFVDQAPAYRRSQLIAALTAYAETHLETYELASYLVGRKEFKLLGLADTGLVSLSQENVIVTMDYKLAGQIAIRHGHVINFNHLRGAQLLPR